MLAYLVRTAVDVFKDEGIGGVTREVLKYTHLYGSPAKVLNYHIARTALRHKRVICDIQGSQMALTLSGDGIHGDLYKYGIREPEATKVMQEIIRPYWTVCDIGANIGYYALMEAKVCRKVYAIEPGPDNYPNLTTNVALNGYRNVRTFNLAIGDKVGSVPFSLNPQAPNWHRVAVGGEKNVVEVPMTTLDEFMWREGVSELHLLRMDVEGYEANILEGAKWTLKTFHPDMFLEVHRDFLKAYGSSSIGVLKFLGSFGYSVYKSFVIGKPGPSGYIPRLLADEGTANLLANKGMASHIFFRWGDTK